MNTVSIRLLLFFAVLVVAAPVTAQSDAPVIHFVHPGVEALNSDLVAVADLTSTKEQEYIEELRLLIEDLALGMDLNHSILVDVVTDVSPSAYLLWMSYEDKSDFIDSLDSLGYPAFQQPDDKSLYLLDDDEGLEQGWLRIFDEADICVVVLVSEKTKAELKTHVQELTVPKEALNRLVELKASAALHLTNHQVAPESQSKRHELFQPIRAEDEALVKQRPDETETAFALRKFTSTIFYDELQRLYSESEDLDLRAHLDREKSIFDVYFGAVPLEESPFAKSVALHGQIPDAFAAITELPDNVLTGRVNYPIDGMRQKHSSQYLDLLTADVHQRIAESEVLQDSEKQATEKIFDDVVKVARNGFASGNVNGFFEAIHDGSVFTLVAALSAPESGTLADTITHVPAARSGNEAELNVAEEGDVAIHRIKLTGGFVEFADRMFGEGQSYYVGLGNDRVWMATGPGALELLKNKIQELGEAAAGGNALTVTMAVEPWAQRLHELAEDQEMPENVADRAAWRENLVRMRQLAESLVKDDDGLKLSIRSDGNLLTGDLQVQKGLLTFLGRQVAKAAKDNLEL